MPSEKKVKKKSAKRNTQSASRSTSKVWRIFHFEQRFEMDSYRRRGGLDYVRMFVTATTLDKSNESSGFIQQLSELEHFYPNLRDTLEGRFWRLCRLTATQEDWLRGYLLDSQQKPLTLARLSARLHLSLVDMKKTLTALKRVGLIEQVDCPEFKKPKREKSKEDKDQSTGQARATASRKRKKTGKKATAAEYSQTFANVSESFNNKIESKKNNKENNLELEENKNRTINQPDHGGQGNKEKTTLSPTPTPPVPSTSPDAPGGIGRKGRRVSPRGSVTDSESVGAVLNLLRYRYTKESLEFADEMLVRMGFMTQLDIERIRLCKQQFTSEESNERAHWAKAWCVCRDQFDDDTMVKLRKKIFEKADAVRVNKAGVRNPAAFLMTAWNNLVRDVRRRCKAM